MKHGHFTRDAIECPNCLGLGEYATGQIDPACGPILAHCEPCDGEGMIEPEEWWDEEQNSPDYLEVYKLSVE